MASSLQRFCTRIGAKNALTLRKRIENKNKVLIKIGDFKMENYFTLNPTFSEVWPVYLTDEELEYLRNNGYIICGTEEEAKKYLV